MAVPTLNSYADVQNLLNTFVTSAGVTPAGAPHGVFWTTLSYEEFTTGNVPGVGHAYGGPYKILEIGDSKNSNLIQILCDPNSTIAKNLGQMPQPSPPYNNATPSQDEVCSALSDWIDRKCPNG